jgi:hypothetical protein
MWKRAVMGPGSAPWMGLLGSAFPLRVSTTQALLDQLLGVESFFGEDVVYSREPMATILRLLSAALRNRWQKRCRPPASSRSRLFTVTTARRRQGRDIWEFPEQAWIPHHRGAGWPSLLPEP